MKATNRNNSSAAQQNSLGSQLDATFGEFYFCFDQKQIQSGVLNSFGHLQKPGGLQGDLAVGGSVSSSTGPTSSEGSSGNASPNHLEQHARAQALSNGHSNGNCNNTNSFFERTNSITHEQSSRSVSASTLLSSEFDFFSSGCSSNDDGIDHWYGPSSASATSGYNSSFNSSFSIGMNGNSTPMRTSTGSNADLNSSMSLFMDASPPHRSQSGTVVPRSPSRIQAPKRQKMSYVTKFGEFGPQAGQFSEPSGVAVTKDKEILVADTNNHRIQIFCAKGTYKYAWGDCGKRDGQMLYPNRVAIAPSGEVIITERAPTHQVQVYSPYGKFIRKFGADVLQHPRGVCVDPSGRIIVVECRVMRVFVFESDGQVYSRFSCSQHLEFPNGVVANNEEIFISDNRAHCVKVFSYHGQFMRQIGGEGLTNFPIGVCLTPRGHILIADNHNNFNVTIFRTDGSLVAAYESKVKHSQCFDVSLLDEGSVVLASKDYRIYVYRYAGGSASSGVNGVSASNGGSVSPDSSCAQTPIGQVATSNGSYCLGGSSSNGFGSPPSPSNLKMTSSVGNLANLYAGMSVDTPTALSGSISPPANCSSTLSPPSSALQHQVSSAAVSIQSLMIDTPLKCAYSNSDHHFSQDAAELLLNGARD